MMNKTNFPLIGGIIAAFLSTVCCIVPLLLLTLGVSGAWMSNLTALEPYKPYFIIVASLLLWITYNKIFLTEPDCEEGKPCAVPENNQKYKIIFWIAVVLILGSATISFWAPLFY
jgi:mercuric ion transport protein